MLQSKTYYSYDERGNLSGEQTRTYVSEGLAGSTAEQAGLSNDANSVKTYHYDRFNRLVEYTDGDTVAEYEYNADNLRTAKTVNGRRTEKTRGRRWCLAGQRYGSMNPNVQD